MERDKALVLLRERIRAFAASHYGREDADDLAQEVLMLLHEKYPHVTELTDLVPLALQIARYKLWAWRRRSRRRGEGSAVPADEVPLASLGPDPLLQAERRERLERLATALGQLGTRCRELFRLKLLGLNFEEIRARLGAATINTVYTWDFRCRRQLMDRLGGEWEGGR